jgi:hypothetical protein
MAGTAPEADPAVAAAKRHAGHGTMRVAITGASHWHLTLYVEPLLEVPGERSSASAIQAMAVVAALCQRLDCAGDIDFRALGAGFRLRGSERIML